MIEELQPFLDFFLNIERVRKVFKDCPDQNAKLTQEDREYLKNLARDWRELFHKHEFDNQEEQVGVFLGFVFTYSAAVTRLRDLESSFRNALTKRYAYVLKEDGYNYISPAGFGEDVRRSFPSAQPEIDAARMCFALGQPTACVFHLMRSVEHLLRVFVVSVGVSQKGPIPLEYWEWQTLIESAESRVRVRLGEPWKSKAAKEAAKSVLRASVSDFYSFKDNVRNILMHTRSSFLDEPTAARIMNRVQTCFERLAPYLTEGKRRSLLVESRWTKAGTPE